MKKNGLRNLTIFVVIIVLIVFFIVENADTVYNKVEYLYSKYIQKDIKQTLIDNKYKKNYDYKYVKIDDNTNLKSKEDIKNAIYTFVDAGWEEYTVKCEPDYEECTSDIKSIKDDENYLTEIMGFVHPYNQFGKIEIKLSPSGIVKFIRTENSYTKEQINIVNSVIDKIYNDNYDKTKNAKENIKIFHDYIINNTKYDKEGKFDNSNNAYGVLTNGYGICSGYTETMQLFLEKMNIKNYRVVSENHTWNLVYIEGKWLHLDLTWDDPLTSDNSDILKYDYFLINNNKLKEFNDGEHNFNENIYLEAK